MGDDVRGAIGIMDRPIATALKDGRAPEALELWQLHWENIGKVHENGGEGEGWKRVKYHPLLMNWAIAF